MQFLVSTMLGGVVTYVSRRMRCPRTLAACAASLLAIPILAADVPPKPAPPSEHVQAAQRGLQLTGGLPGADAPDLQIPPFDPKNPEARNRAIDAFFPPLPPLPPPIEASFTNEAPPLSAFDAVGAGIVNSPVIRQASGQIRAAYGEAIQMGMYPNPTLGYEGDTIGTLNTAGYHGPFITQTIKTGGKLQLARASFMINVRNAELSLQKSRIEVATQAFGRYYDLLVAFESVQVTTALAQFTDHAYRLQVELLRGGEAAAYEPMQQRAIAMAARAQAIQARNRYFSALKQLAAAMSVHDLPPMPLTSDEHAELPHVEFGQLEMQMLNSHPDLLSARNSVQQARLNVRRAEVVPVPDVLLYSTVQKDYTGPPFGTTVNVQASIPVPVFDRNRGGITQAQGMLAKAANEEQRVRNQLLTQLAAAFERYENTRAIAAIYRRQILPDQARAYRGVYNRYQQEPLQVNFGDVVVAQQNYAQATINYFSALTEQWRATADLLNLIQLASLEELAMLVCPPQPAEEIPPAPPRQ